MGYLLVNVQLPDSASLERTQTRSWSRSSKIARDDAGRQAHASTIAGQSFLLNANGSNFGSMFVILDDVRRTPRARTCTATRSPTSCASSSPRRSPRRASPSSAPPPVRGLGRAGGFKLMVEDRGDVGPQALQEQTDNLVEQGNQKPGLVGLFSRLPRQHAAALRRRRPDASA